MIFNRLTLDSRSIIIVYQKPCRPVVRAVNATVTECPQVFLRIYLAINILLIKLSQIFPNFLKKIFINFPSHLLVAIHLLVVHFGFPVRKISAYQITVLKVLEQFNMKCYMLLDSGMNNQELIETNIQKSCGKILMKVRTTLFYYKNPFYKIITMFYID